MYVHTLESQNHPLGIHLSQTRAKDVKVLPLFEAATDSSDSPTYHGLAEHGTGRTSSLSSRPVIVSLDLSFLSFLVLTIF